MAIPAVYHRPEVFFKDVLRQQDLRNVSLGTVLRLGITVKYHVILEDVPIQHTACYCLFTFKAIIE